MVIVDLAVFERTAPDQASYTYLEDYIPFSYSGEGDVTGAVTAVDINVEGRPRVDERLRGGGLHRVRRRVHRIDSARDVRLQL